MRNIYLVRHGESVGNLNPRIYTDIPDHAIELSARGFRQAHAAGAALKSLLRRDGVSAGDALRVWTSPYRRTRQTAQALFEQLQGEHLQLDIREHINLCEQQFGLFDGISEEEQAQRMPAEYAHYDLARRHEGRFWARMPMGESRFDVAVRVHEAFGTFHRDAERHGVRDIVVVCHGVTMRAFVMQWLHLPYEWFEAQPNPGNCDIYHLPSRDSGREGGFVYRGGAVA